MALLRRLVRRRTALFGLLVVLAVMLAAAAAPLVAPFDPLEQDIGQRLREPGWQDAQGRVHALGTDHLGPRHPRRASSSARASRCWSGWPRC